MKPFTIKIETRGSIEAATIECDRAKSSLTFTMQNGTKNTYSTFDLYICFGMLRADHPEIKFLCKGAKLNVHPSRMSSQMSKGLVAYEVELGKCTEEENIVRVFDYDDENITNNIEEQEAFYKKWIDSLRPDLGAPSNFR